MNKLIKLIIRYQENHEDILFQEIVRLIYPMYKQYLNRVNFQKEEDLYQELLMKTYYLIRKFRILIFIKDTNFNIKWFKLFLKKYNISNINETNRKEVLNEYGLFICENMFIKYLSKSLYSSYLDFVTREQKYEDHIFLELNRLDVNEQEKLEQVKSNESYNLDFCSVNLSQEDKQFLLHFIEGGKLLSETSVAKKLGVTQQAVNKRKQKIIQKYKKNNND